MALKNDLHAPEDEISKFFLVYLFNSPYKKPCTFLKFRLAVKSTYWTGFPIKKFIMDDYWIN